MSADDDALLARRVDKIVAITDPETVEPTRAALRARKPDPFCPSCGVVLDLHGTDEADDFDCQTAVLDAVAHVEALAQTLYDDAMGRDWPMPYSSLTVSDQERWRGAAYCATYALAICPITRSVHPWLRSWCEPSCRTAASAQAEARPEPKTAPLIAQPQTVDHLAAAMHVAYESEAVRAGWETQERSRVPYEALPEANKRAMRAGVLTILDLLYRDGWRKQAEARGVDGA